METEILDRVRSHRDWLGSLGREVHANDSRMLNDFLRKPTPDGFREIQPSLFGLALYYGIRGICRALDDDPAGWVDVGTSLDFHAWIVMIKVRLYELGRAPAAEAIGGGILERTVLRAALLGACSEGWEALSRATLAEYLGRKDAQGPDSKVREDFPAFVLAALQLGRTSAPSEGPTSPQTSSFSYARVLRLWENEEALAQALREFCELEWHKAVAEAGAFGQPPFDLLPCSMMLMRHLKEASGSRLPTVDHPLLNMFEGVPSRIRSAETSVAELEQLAYSFGELLQ